MKKKIAVYILISVWLSVTSFLLNATDSVPLEELNNPKNMIIDGDDLIVSDYPYVYIYRLKDKTLKKKIGGRGQGPGEFYIDVMDLGLKAKGLVVSTEPGKIVVWSLGKVSYFDRQGAYISTLKAQHAWQGGQWLVPFGNRFAGSQMTRRSLGSKNLTAHLNLYDKNLKRIKRIYSCPAWLSLDRSVGYNFFKRMAESFIYRVYEDKIFVVPGGNDKFEILVFDSAGAKLKELRMNYRQVKLEENFIGRVKKYYRIKFKRGLEANLKMTKYPEYFPAIRDIAVADGKIYVITFKKENGKTEMIILDLNGAVIKKSMLTIYERNPEYLCPYSIRNRKLYQLVENEEDENWELIVTGI